MGVSIQKLYNTLCHFLGYCMTFSSIQKLVIFTSSVFISCWLAKSFCAALFLTFSILCSVLTCHVLTSLDRNYSGLRVILIFYTTYKTEIATLKRWMRKVKVVIRTILWERDEVLLDEFQENLPGETNTLNHYSPDGSPGMKGKSGKTKLQSEVDIISHLIVQDFIKPWYCVRHQEEEFVFETESILQECIGKFFLNLSKVDMHYLVKDVLVCYLDHLNMFQTAKMTYKMQPKRRRSTYHRDSPVRVGHQAFRNTASVEEAFEIKFTYHSAVWDTESELNYVKSLTQLLLTCLLGSKLDESKSSKILLVEILSCNVILPLIELLSDADFLHESIIRILSDEAPVEVSNDTDDELDDHDEEKSDKSQFKDLKHMTDQLQDSKTGRSDSHAQCSDTCIVKNNQRDYLRQTSEITTFDEVPAMLLAPALLRVSSESNVEQANKEHCHSSQKDDIPVLEVGKNKHVLKNLKERKGNSEVAESIEEGEDASTSVLKDVKSTKPASEDLEKSVSFSIGSESYEELSIEEQKVENTTKQTFQDINIIETETTTESRSSSQYTLYVIEYKAWYTSEDNAKRLRTQTVKRRFREFVNLQGRLEDNESYKGSLKDTKGIKPWISLPFGNMDRASVESRKFRLEAYIKSLILKSDIGNGPELKEFLGFCGDGHIAFVRKAPESSIPRIDQMLVKTVTGVIDKIGGKVDQLTTKASEVLPTFSSKKDITTWDPNVKYDKDEDNIPLKFGFIKSETWQMEEHLVQFIENLEKQDKTSKEAGMETKNFVEKAPRKVDCSEQTLSHDNQPKNEQDQRDNKTDKTDSDDPIQNEENMNSSIAESHQELRCPEEVTSRGKQRDLMQDPENEGSSTTQEKSVEKEKYVDGETMLAEVVVDVGVQALQGRDVWICRERVISLTKHITATALHRWLEMEIDDLTSQTSCLHYIHILKEILWPEGQYASPRRQVKSDKQKMATKTQARRCLSDFFPDFIRSLLDTTDYAAAIDEVIDSLQYEKLNKNFIYTVLDIVIEKMFPDISWETIQD